VSHFEVTGNSDRISDIVLKHNRYDKKKYFCSNFGDNRYSLHLGDTKNKKIDCQLIYGKMNIPGFSKFWFLSALQFDCQFN